jgi:hypothetical protein
MKIRNLVDLKRRVTNHYNRYKEYQAIGKLRAEGRLKLHRGSLSGEVDSLFNTESWKLTFHDHDKEHPHFKGNCQAMNTGDVFNVAAWLNPHGNLRIEIYEVAGYARKNKPPF